MAAVHKCRDVRCGWILTVVPGPASRAVLLTIRHSQSHRDVVHVALDNAAIPALIADLLIASGRTPDLPTHPEETHVDDHARHS